MKNYSSGMRARLGFAVATVVDPEVLILDEVLSVGDARFRQKSEAKIMNMFDKGTTVVFVSHNTDQVRRICNRAILLQKGQIIAQGTTEEVCAIYDEMTKKKLQATACRIRMGVIEGTYHAKSGHPGGSLSICDTLTYLYFAMQIKRRSYSIRNNARSGQ